MIDHFINVNNEFSELYNGEAYRKSEYIYSKKVLRLPLVLYFFLMYKMGAMQAWSRLKIGSISKSKFIELKFF
jgi:hypothetical protein